MENVIHVKHVKNMSKFYIFPHLSYIQVFIDSYFSYGLADGCMTKVNYIIHSHVSPWDVL